MGRRNFWGAVRMVAENIHAGDRSLSNLLKIPDLPTSGREAIRELEEKGLVKASWRDDRVEPTEAFWPWIAEQQLEETAQAIARQTGLLTPWQVPAPAPATNKPAPVALAVSDELASRPSSTEAPATSKFRRPQVLRPDLTRFDAFCVRLLHCLRHLGGRVASSQLRRGVSGYRHPEIYDDALQRLEKLGAIKVEKEPGTRRKWVTLLKIPPKYEETRPKPKRQRHKPRSRGQTMWFQGLMDEQELLDGGSSVTAQ